MNLGAILALAFLTPPQSGQPCVWDLTYADLRPCTLPRTANRSEADAPPFGVLRDAIVNAPGRTKLLSRAGGASALNDAVLLEFVGPRRAAYLGLLVVHDSAGSRACFLREGVLVEGAISDTTWNDVASLARDEKIRGLIDTRLSDSPLAIVSVRTRASCYQYAFSGLSPGNPDATAPTVDSDCPASSGEELVRRLLKLARELEHGGRH